MATGQRLVVSIEGKQEVGLAESCCCVKVSLGALANVLTEQIN